MNERIQKLAEQALQLVADEHTGGDESRLNTDSYHVKDLIHAKFAELIVKEAGKYLTSPEFIGRSDLDWSMVLTEHFGVE